MAYNDVSDRAELLEHLQVTNDHIAESERHIARQRQLLASLHRRSAIIAAEQFLDALMHVQEMYVAHHERLEIELAKANSNVDRA